MSTSLYICMFHELPSFAVVLCFQEYFGMKYIHLGDIMPVSAIAYYPYETFSV